MNKPYCQLITSWDCAKSIPINFNRLLIIFYLRLIFLKKGILWIMRSLNNWLKHMNCNKDIVKLFFIMKNFLMNLKESNFLKVKFIKKLPKFIKNKEISMIMTDSWNLHSVNIVNSTIKENFLSLLVSKSEHFYIRRKKIYSILIGNKKEQFFQKGW